MNKSKQFVVCLSKEHFPELIFGKIYPVLPDAKGEQEGYLRIIGESGESYLFPQSWFRTVKVSQEVARKLSVAV